MTTGYSVVTSSDLITAGETGSVWLPTRPVANNVGVVLVHGANNVQGFIDGSGQPSAMRLAASIAAAGCPCVAGEFGGPLGWANDSVMAGMTSAAALLKATAPYMRQDRVALVGLSMGGAGVARYSQINPDLVCGVIGIIPAFDLRYEYENVATVTNSIAAAWNVVAPAPLPAAADLQANAALAAGIPLLAGYSTVDTTVPPAPVVKYVQAVGGTAIITDTTFGHSDQAIAGMPIATVVTFLKKLSL